MNLVKTLIGVLCLGLTVIAAKDLQAMDFQAFLLLGMSGLLGIAVGDTFFFKSLLCLNPRLAVLTGTLGPVCTVLLAILFLHERLSMQAALGGILTIGGVTYVLWEQAPRENGDKGACGSWISGSKAEGVFYGVLAALCTAAGIILAKEGIEKVSAAQATLVRFAWGAAALLFLGAQRGDLARWLTPFKSAALMKRIIVAVLVVIFGGFYLSLVALKHIDASIATVLNATEPLFIIPLAAMVLKESISLRAIAGAVIATAGVVLIFLQQMSGPQ
jgi:drug/metabolite transporter (DMT)-like permease